MWLASFGWLGPITVWAKLLPFWIPALLRNCSRLKSIRQYAFDFLLRNHDGAAETDDLDLSVLDGPLHGPVGLSNSL